MVSIRLLLDFEFSALVLGVGSGSIGFVVPLRFKTLDSQPSKSILGPVSMVFHDFLISQKRCHGFLAPYLSCFRTGGPKFGFSNCSDGTEKLRDGKLRRLVVVSLREVFSVDLFMTI